MTHLTLPGNGAALQRRRSRTGLRVAAALGLTLAVTLPAFGQPYLRSPGGNGVLLAQQPAAQPAQPPAVVPPKPADLPVPRTTDFSAQHPRLSGLPASVPAPLGTTPAPTKEVLDRFAKYIGKIVDPENTLDLIVGRTRLIQLKESPFRVAAADDRLMTWNLVTPRELLVQGTAVGTTVLNFWFGDPNEPAKQTILSYLVHILPDPEAKERLERTYKALEEEINRAFPDAYVCLFLVADKVVVSGEAKDVIEAQKILQIVSSTTGANAASTIPVGQVNLNLTPEALGPSGLPANALEQFLNTGVANIVNLLRVPGEQQVMLKVTVAEISRSAARSIGLNFSIRNNQGIQVFAQTTGNLLTGGLGAGANPVNLPVLLDNGQVSLAIEALRTVNLAKSLAEPNLVTLNGHPAYFQSGGEFPVPVVTGATATGLQGVSFVPFGVLLAFTPIITDKDRIRLSLNATVSVRDVGLGTNFGGGQGGQNGGGFVSGLNTRTITTTVEMREGQTLAIGGLVQTNLGADSSRVPGIGDIPLIGLIGRTDRTSASESELVLLVTPQIVRPMEPKEVPPLPGSDYFEPGDLEFYLLGRLESRRAYDYRSPAMTTIGRMAAYRHCELLYFVGPHGHSECKP